MGYEHVPEDRSEDRLAQEAGVTDRNPFRILLIGEEDPCDRRLLGELLAAGAAAFEVEARADRAPGRILDERPDVVVVDLERSELDGPALCRRLGLPEGRARLVLVPPEAGGPATAASAPGPAPRAGRAGLDPPIELGTLCVDGATRSATLAGVPVPLTSAEFDVLWSLACRAGRVTAREALYREVRGRDWDGQDRSVDLRISRLRRKLGDDARRPRWIKSVRGRGYLLSAPR